MQRWFSPAYEKFTVPHYGFPKSLLNTLRPEMKAQAIGQGIGRHTDAERWGLFSQDLLALSKFLGMEKALIQRIDKYRLSIYDYLQIPFVR